MIHQEEISVSQFKATCLSVLAKVNRTGQSVLVTKRGKPMAVINPPPAPEKMAVWLGALKDHGKIIGDVVSPVSDGTEWAVLNE